MAIKVSGNAFQGISALGSSAPEAGFYEVSIVALERAPTDKPTTRRVHVQFENGFKMFSFLSVPFDESGNMLTDGFRHRGCCRNQHRLVPYGEEWWSQGSHRVRPRSEGCAGLIQ